MSFTEVVQQCSTVTELYNVDYTPTLSLSVQETTTQSNYIKIIRSIDVSSVVDILPSVVEHIHGCRVKLERLELIQETRRKLQDPRIAEELSAGNILNPILTQLLDIFTSDSSQSVQFELISIICVLPQCHLTERVLAKLHSAALSSSPLIRRQSLMLVMRTLPYSVSLKFLFAYLDDDDPRVRTTAIQKLYSAAEHGCDIPYSVYQKIISSLSDSHHEVRLHSVRLLPHLVRQHRAEIITQESGRTMALTHHTFIQLCMLMRDINTGVRAETARVLGTFTDVDPEYLKQTLDKKVRANMRIVPGGAKGKQEFSCGRKWGGDAPIKAVLGEINIFDPAGCGAFVHGMEDEYSEVRANTVRTMCALSSCGEFGVEAMPHLVDMLNDEIQGVRLLAISSLQSISQNVLLHEDQLETVMSVLEESNVEIRHSLHQLLSTCKLNSLVAVRRVLRGLLDNLKKYPQDKSSIFKCVRGVGDNNGNYVALLAPEMLSKHPYLSQTEPSTDDASYVATMILVFNAAQHNSIIFSMFHSYTPKHYVYIASLLPDLVPQLPQVHKILKSSDATTDLTSITGSLNVIVKQFLKLCQTGPNVGAMSKALDDIMKIQKCSSKIHAQTKYATLLVGLIIQLFKLLALNRKRLADGMHRVHGKIKDLVYDLCLLESTFSGSVNVCLTAKLTKFYCLQFLHKHISSSAVTVGEVSAYRSHVSEYCISNNVTCPIQITECKHFDLFNYLCSQSTVVSPEIQHSTATILAPQTNRDRVNEFPSHLSHSVQVEAETERAAPTTLAVKLRYPGDREVICQPALRTQLNNYYQNTVFIGSNSWSDPGIVDLAIVSEYSFEKSEAALQRLYGKQKIWLRISDSVQIKVHPRIPR